MYRLLSRLLFVVFLGSVGSARADLEFEVTGGLRVNDYLTLPPATLPAAGTTFARITGVLQLRHGNFKIEPRDAADLVP